MVVLLYIYEIENGGSAMLIKHETQTTVYAMRNDELLQCFMEAWSMTQQLMEIDRAFKQYEDEEIDDEELFDVLEDSGYFSYSTFGTFCDCVVSKSHVTVKYLLRVHVRLKNLVKNLRLIMDYECPPTKEECSVVRDELYDVIGGLLYFLVTEFKLTDVLADVLAQKEDLAVDEIYSMYCATTVSDPADFAHQVYELSQEYKYHLDFFDDYPEKEEAFEAVMGPYIVGIDEGCLTLELVDGVIAGTITPGELLSIVNPVEGDE